MVGAAAGPSRWAPADARVHARPLRVRSSVPVECLASFLLRTAGGVYGRHGSCRRAQRPGPPGGRGAGCRSCPARLGSSPAGRRNAFPAGRTGEVRGRGRGAEPGRHRGHPAGAEGVKGGREQVPPIPLSAVPAARRGAVVVVDSPAAGGPGTAEAIPVPVPGPAGVNGRALGCRTLVQGPGLPAPDTVRFPLRDAGDGMPGTGPAGRRFSTAGSAVLRSTGKKEVTAGMGILRVLVMPEHTTNKGAGGLPESLEGHDGLPAFPVRRVPVATWRPSPWRSPRRSRSRSRP